MTVQFNKRTKSRGIEWCDETRNAMGGCPHQCEWNMQDGSRVRCYAKALAVDGVQKPHYPHGFEHHYWRPKALEDLTAGKRSKLIFVDSMSDLFAAAVPEEHVIAVLQAMGRAPHHTYQSLTKAAPQILKYLDRLPPNLWVGVSTPPDWFVGRPLTRQQQEALLRCSLDVLRQVRERTGNLVWLSAEPASWDVSGLLDDQHPLDWIVIGAASAGQRYFQPEPEHVLRLLTIMNRTKTPVFFKGNIRPLFEQHNFGTPELNRWREDFPTTYRNGEPIRAVDERQKACEEHGWPKIAK
jgi:protein gp37